MRHACVLVFMSLLLAACERQPQQATQAAQPVPPAPVGPGEEEPAAAPSLAFRCGDLDVFLVEAGAASTLRIAGRKVALTPQVAASGARYAGTDAGQPLEFWTKGEEASLRIGEQSFPTCLPPGYEAAAATTYRASGNEPAWLLELGDDSLELVLDMGSRRLVGTDLRQEDGEAGPLYAASTEAGDVQVQIVESLCRDSMSGMPRPDFVAVELGEQRLEGCGGDPATLLQGGAWRIDSVNGRERVADSQPVLEFLPDGALSGNASCNRLSGAWRVGGEALHIPMPVVTRMACASAVMEQEGAVLDILQGDSRFDFDDAGRLVITGAKGSQLRAVRQFEPGAM